MDNGEIIDLLVNDDYKPFFSEHEASQLKPIQKKFFESYIKNRDTMGVEEWLLSELQDSMPDRNVNEIDEMRNEILNTLKMNEDKQSSMNKALKNGRSKESWFASETKQATSYLSTNEASHYLNDLDSAVSKANDALNNTLTTQSGLVSQNPNLDGFIAEQYHSQTFNLNAEATGSPYRAKVLEPNGNRYSKNSVDIVIVDGSGKVVQRYQVKYCKDGKSTAKAFEKGDYRGQQKLVADGQETELSNKATNVLKAPDGTTSNPLTKDLAKKRQQEAQSGNWNELNWNEYKAKDLTIGIGKKAGYAALQGAAIGIGFDMAYKVWNKEEIKGEEIVKTAIVSGSDFGIKAAAAGALKVGVEKGIIKAIPKGTPASTITNIVYVGIENTKILSKVASGELSFAEGIEKMEQTSVSTIAGMVMSAKGTAIGAAIGAVFGPVGIAVGGFVGGTVGYMAGSKTGEAVVNGAQKIRKKAKTILQEIANTIIYGVDSVNNEIINLYSDVKSILS